jgi:histidinol-phosphate aminotransferase
MSTAVGIPQPSRDAALVAGYHSPQVEVAVRLNTNESPYGPPAEWLEEVRSCIGELELNRYPDRDASALRTAIAERHGTTSDRVWCGNGSNEVLQALLLAFGGPGRSVALFEPTYALHSHIARITGTGVEAGGRDGGLLIDLAEVDRVIERASRSDGDRDGAGNPVITFICSPNNPTGRAEPRATVEAVLERAPGLVVVDEAYAQFSPWSALELRDPATGELPPRLVVVRTFSKTWALAGLRLGYLIASPEVVAAAAQVTLPYHLDSFKQAACRLALSYDGALADRVEALVSERSRLQAALSQMPVESWPSDANFILFRPLGRDAGEVWEALVDRSVLVRDVSTFGGLEGCLRVTVGTPAEDGAFLAALSEALEGGPQS